MYRKKIAAIIVFGLTMTTCATPANGQSYDVLSSMSEGQRAEVLELIQEEKVKQAAIQAAQVRAQIVIDNTKKMNRVVKKLSKTVGKTWYVFSGSTPSGWDCSGMTMWFYGHLGVKLEHRATKQSQSGMHTDNPKLGDIVVFKYKGSKSAYHVGIWISEDKMLHSGGKEGDRTEYESISRFAGNYSEVSYRTLIETS